MVCLCSFIEFTIRKFAPVLKKKQRFEDVWSAEGIATRYLDLNTTQISYHLEASGERIFTPSWNLIIFLQCSSPQPRHSIDWGVSLHEKRTFRTMLSIKRIVLCAKLAGIEIAHISMKVSHTVRKNMQGLSADYVTEDGWMDKHVLHSGMNNSGSGHRYCPTCTTATVPKIRRKSKFAHVGTEHTSGELYMNIEGNPAAIQMATVWKLFCSSKTAPRPVLFFCHFLYIALSVPQEKIWHVWKMSLIRFWNFKFSFLKLLNLKLPKFWNVCSKKKKLYDSNMTNLWYINQCN